MMRPFAVSLILIPVLGLAVESDPVVAAPAASGAPAGEPAKLVSELPMENLELSDGRRFVGTYDGATGTLSAYFPSGVVAVQIRPDQIARRGPYTGPAMKPPEDLPGARVAGGTAGTSGGQVVDLALFEQDYRTRLAAWKTEGDPAARGRLANDLIVAWPGRWSLQGTLISRAVAKDPTSGGETLTVILASSREGALRYHLTAAEPDAEARARADARRRAIEAVMVADAQRPQAAGKAPGIAGAYDGAGLGRVYQALRDSVMDLPVGTPVICDIERPGFGADDAPTAVLVHMRSAAALPATKPRTTK